jgi:Golgi phosphoprotein 3 (GPP34)
MDALGEDLVLLSIRPDNGTIATKSRLGYGLRGSELVRLAASGRVGIAGDRIAVLDTQPTGDEQLDAALASLAGARRPPRPKTWVGHPGSQIVNIYLARLAATGAIRPERGTVLAFVTVVRWRIADTARAADARARLDSIARATGPVDTAQAAFAGLASASGLGPVLYPGWANRQLRRRLERIAKGELSQGAGAAPTAQATRATDAAARATVQSATDAAVQSVTDAATQAATDAATAAATQAATYAAVSPAVHAAHHAASDGGHGGHGGGGGGGHQ